MDLVNWWVDLWSSARWVSVEGISERNACVVCGANSLCRLLNPNTPILSYLGEHFPFETAVGMNGRVWINSEEAKNTILISNAIQNSEYLSADECKQMVQDLVNKL